MEKSNEKKGSDSKSGKFIKSNQPAIPGKQNANQAKAVTTNNNACETSPSTEKSSNVGQGPSVENL
jgi:hypothetical protein